MIMEKVYCNDCQYLKAHRNFIYGCQHPNNMHERRNWLRIYLIPNQKPEKINKHNDCKWFEKIRKPILSPPPPRP
jgi:hypothetical protein